MRLVKTSLLLGTAVVWLVNGLACKILHLVPRHRQIVARILGHAYATELTSLIGFSEVLMAGWILSGIKPRWCAYCQIALVLLMNLLEFTLAPDLLLFGRVNLLVALLFTGVVYFTEHIPVAPYRLAF